MLFHKFISKDIFDLIIRDNINTSSNAEGIINVIIDISNAMLDICRNDLFH